MTTLIRQLTHDDIEAFRKVASTTYIQAYSEKIAETDLRQFIAAQFAPDAVRAAMHIADIQVLFVGQCLVGYYWAEPSPIPSSGHNADNSIELLRLYLLKDMRGRGHGRLMMDTFESNAHAAGHDSVWLKVWDQNPNAIVFYKSSGFRIAGECTFECGTLLCNDFVMVKQMPEQRGLTIA